MSPVGTEVESAVKLCFLSFCLECEISTTPDPAYLSAETDSSKEFCSVACPKVHKVSPILRTNSHTHVDTSSRMDGYTRNLCSQDT